MSSERWIEFELGELVDVKHGFAFKGEFFSEVPTSDILLTPGNFNIGGGFKSDKFKYYNGSFPKSYILAENDIIVTMTDLSKAGDTLGYSAKVPRNPLGNFLHNQRIGLLVFKDDRVNKDFIYWLLRTSGYHLFIVNSATGSTVKHTSPTRILQYRFKAPVDKNSQTRIASILSSLDDKIELNRQTNKTLEEIAQTLFKEMCLPKGDVLPEGWRVGAIGELFNFVIGGDWGKDDYLDEYPNLCTVIRGTDIDDIYNASLTKLPMRYIKSTNLLKRELKVGDIVFEISGGSKNQATGRSFFITKEIRELFSTSIIPASFCRLIRLNNIEDSYFVGIYLRMLYSEGGTWEYQIQSTGISNFQFQYFSEKHNVFIPPKEVLSRFANIVKSIYAKIGNNLIEIQTLTTLRDTLLPKLMKGEIDIPI